MLFQLLDYLWDGLHLLHLFAMSFSKGVQPVIPGVIAQYVFVTMLSSLILSLVITEMDFSLLQQSYIGFAILL